jgi:hypothetical protein
MLLTLIREVLQNSNMETRVRVGETAYEVKHVSNEHSNSGDVIPVLVQPRQNWLSVLSGMYQYIIG